MEDNIKEAIKLLRKNDYVVIKLTPDMIKDIKECDAYAGDKDCLGCSCNVCLVN